MFSFAFDKIIPLITHKYFTAILCYINTEIVYNNIQAYATISKFYLLERLCFPK